MKLHIIIAAIFLLAFTACGEQSADQSNASNDHEEHSGTEAPTNRTPIPPVVRRNLGITFAKAQYRPVAATVVVPGHFEPQPSAQHHYPLPANGRVTVHVKPLQQVDTGQLLFELDAPAWRLVQRELVETKANRLRAEAELAKARAAKEAAGAFADENKSGTDVFTAEVLAVEASLNAAVDRFEQLIAEAATLTGLTTKELLKEKDGKPMWRRLQAIPIRAVDGGVVRQVDSASGSWAEEGAELVHVVHPTTLRFRGRALQSDLIDFLREGQQVRIVVPEGKGNKRRVDGIAGTLQLGVTGDASARTVDVFVDIETDAAQKWMRPEVTAFAEVAVDGDPDAEELAIPVRAIIQDGLDTVYFRRDRKDPDAVIRTIADLGPSDGKWVTVYSGLAEGDEVVIDGVYQLKLATTGQDVTAGHFHSDGTWHEGDH